MPGLIAYGAHVPYHRLARADVAATLGTPAAKGTRAVAGYDEDTTSMAVEAARTALARDCLRPRVGQLFLATAAPAYLDKTNATAVHAALRLDEHVLAVDMAGSVRSGLGALVTAARSAVPTLAVLSDLRTGLPGGSDEIAGGDGAAAFVFGGHRNGAPVLAELLAHDTVSDEILERWRLPGAPASRVWEERFAEEIYVSLADKALTAALDQAGLERGAIDHLIVSGLHARACAAVRRGAGTRPEAVTPDLATSIGNAGTAQPGLLLADVLDRAAPGETIALVVLGDGAGVLLLRTTDALPAHRSARPVAAQIAAGSAPMPYATYLTWRGMLDREPPRRPDPEPPYAPPAHRRTAWKYGFVASRCEKCGTRHLPPDRVCASCRSVDTMTDEPMQHVRGTVATFTVDRLAHTPSPPMLVVVVDYDGGGRFRCQLTDATEADAVIGARVEMTFRRTVTAAGVHNYFWKARPVRIDDEETGR
ncbi:MULTISPECIES: OB-fold domain-containing protein [unclassified Streptomyces]|uniref:OB-fold domain-containing protein n=1 Tax=unclassified Streptomyces TaxID=2593676 RepID=UPI002E791873|nr:MULTISPECIES: OB-fold domain-containing protein [unclassified Streptomyces]MEE1762800.1 OB-fold domain-containing protein [Streptomyces sp. SP18BB07]MEE1833056.1 OB-fold domain-containing protein [Streptomyces sp. SP17KL33]